MKSLIHKESGNDILWLRFDDVKHDLKSRLVWGIHDLLIVFQHGTLGIGMVAL